MMLHGIEGWYWDGEIQSGLCEERVAAQLGTRPVAGLY